MNICFTRQSAPCRSSKDYVKWVRGEPLYLWPLSLTVNHARHVLKSHSPTLIEQLSLHSTEFWVHPRGSSPSAVTLTSILEEAEDRTNAHDRILELFVTRDSLLIEWAANIIKPSTIRNCWVFYIIQTTRNEYIQSLRSALSKGTNRVDVSSLLTWGAKEIQFPKRCVF
jgi:hypothetical protein